MLFFITIITLLQFISAFEPSCLSCKHFIPNVKIFDDLGLCNMFKEVSTYKDKRYVLSNYAVHCRENENLCGKSGFLYEPKNEPKDESRDDKFYKEVSETEQLEKDFFEVLQKIKRHNTKKIYNTTKDLYKLFKKDKNT